MGGDTDRVWAKLIPRDLVESRLSDPDIPAQERSVLEDQIKLLDA